MILQLHENLMLVCQAANMFWTFAYLWTFMCLQQELLSACFLLDFMHLHDCLAPLVLSLIPVSGKHQPFETQMAGFLLSLLSSSHQIWGTAGPVMTMICLPPPVCLTGWEHTRKMYALGETQTLTNEHTHTRTHTIKHPLCGADRQAQTCEYTLAQTQK